MVVAYYAHPAAWNEIGFGGPASPRGYVRMDFDRRDPWEASKRDPAAKRVAGREESPMSDDPGSRPARRRAAARPTCSAPAAGRRCAVSTTTRQSTSPSSARARAAGRWPANLPNTGSRSSPSTPGPIGGRSRTSPRTRREQAKLYWTDERIVEGDNPLTLGSNNSGKSVGGSTVHFAMVSLRFRPEWFKARTQLGYGADWPLDWREMWHYYREVEEALKISGPVNYPWGPKRPRYPYRAHELNAAGPRAGGGRRSAGHRLDADAARDGLGAARPVATLASIAACA